MSIVDDIAEAICNAHCGDIEAWEITYDKGRDHWRRVAEAALEAIAAYNATYPADPPVLPEEDQSVFRSGGQISQFGPRPRISVARPNLT